MSAKLKHQLGLRSGDAERGSDARRPSAAGAYDPAAPAPSGAEGAGAGEQTLATADDVLDVAGATRLLRIGRNMVYELVARNAIPHRRLGKQIRFSRTAIMRWLDSSWSPRIAKEGQ